MTAREILDQGFARSFISRFFGDEMPEDYKKLEAKYIDQLHQTAYWEENSEKQREQIAVLNSEKELSQLQIAELNSEKELSQLRESILLGVGARFSAFPSSIVQKIYSICQKSVLSQIYDALQKSVALEEFEQDFNRLAVVEQFVV